ncbi:hypothetical protein DPMN_125998 [Dreissena polymorpha]|uniref:Uncharacterized protein n=1 Tax=Dreissena polymorpha TaxID=45954 RepID=A0A9D4GWA6_DREPO|nr:hypothetical protein DPMN_125998 [Dreissena polymorpha]
MLPKSVRMFNSSFNEYKTYSPFRSVVDSWEYLIHVEKRPLVKIVRLAFLLTTSQATSLYRALKHFLDDLAGNLPISGAEAFPSDDLAGNLPISGAEAFPCTESRV